MIRPVHLALAAIVLAACSTPPAGIDRLSDVELAEDASVAGAVDPTADPEPARGIFAGIFGSRKRAPEPDLAPEAAAPADASPDQPDPAPKRGLAGLFQRKPGPDPQPQPDAIPAPETNVDAQPESLDPARPRGLAGLFKSRPREEPTAASDPVPASEATETAAATDTETDAVAEAARPRGLFGLFGKRSAPAATEVASVDPRQPAPPPAAVPPETEAAEATAPVKTGWGGLFGGKPRADAGTRTAALAPQGAAKAVKPKGPPKGDGPDAAVVPMGSVVPFGQVARVCGVREAQLGRPVARYPESGPRYTVRDSAPGQKEPHPIYITGFEDGCARIVTGALVLFGDATIHEQIRYVTPTKVRPFSDTDKAYERIKSTVCKVGRMKPCGANIATLEASTVFLTVYERFGDQGAWMNLLIHDGDVEAVDLRQKR